MTAKAIFSTSLGLALALALAGCAPSAQERHEEPALAWPAAPDPPRLAYVRAFSRPEDLGIERGLLARLGDLLFGRSETRLIRPMSVVTVGDVVYVADPGVKGVHRFDRARGEYALIQGPQERPLLSPVGLARGAEGEVYVSDSALAAVYLIRPGAKTAAPLPLQAKLQQPTGLAFDPASGRLFVVDTRAHCVQVFDRGGALVTSIGRRGTADGEFNYPTLAWRNAEGRLYVTDALNFRVQMFDPQGHFVGKFGRYGDGNGDLGRQKGVATDRYGHVYVVDSLFNALQVFDERGALLLSVGTLGRERGEFWLPTGIFIDEHDRIYIADSYNQRVQVLRYVGGAV